MLKKDFSALTVVDVAPRYGVIGEGIHLVTITDARRMPQNQYCSLSDVGAKIVLGEMKPEAIAKACFDQEVTTMVFQLTDGTNVIMDHRSDYGWAKKDETFFGRHKKDVVDEVTGEVLHKKGSVNLDKPMILNQQFIDSNGLKEFAGKWYLPAKGNTPDIGIEDAGKESDCFKMLCKVYGACGLVGAQINPANLIGKTLKIKVIVNPFTKPTDKFDRFKVDGWYPADANVTSTSSKPVVADEDDDDLPF